MEETQEQKPKSIQEQLQDRIQQLEMQKKQMEMGYAETIGAIAEAKHWLNIMSQ